MTFRQRLLKTLYPIIAKGSRNTPNGFIARKPQQSQRGEPVSNISIQLNSGQNTTLKSFEGKKILLVNTASDCGYTGQYAELQKLQVAMPNKLVVIGFPANDFKEQEKLGDAEIANFCQRNYGVTFPLAKKSVVAKKAGQNPLFTWLSDPRQNGWNKQEPVWNFTKYLLNEQGELEAVFGPAISPLDKEITDLL